MTTILSEMPLLVASDSVTLVLVTLPSIVLATGGIEVTVAVDPVDNVA